MEVERHLFSKSVGAAVLLLLPLGTNEENAFLEIIMESRYAA
jgi:hypothetical protein